MTHLSQVIKAFVMLTFVFLSIYLGYIYLPLVALIGLFIWAISIRITNSIKH